MKYIIFLYFTLNDLVDVVLSLSVCNVLITAPPIALKCGLFYCIHLLNFIKVKSGFIGQRGRKSRQAIFILLYNNK